MHLSSSCALIAHTVGSNRLQWPAAAVTGGVADAVARSVATTVVHSGQAYPEPSLKAHHRELIDFRPQWLLA